MWKLPLRENAGGWRWWQALPQQQANRKTEGGSGEEGKGELSVSVSSLSFMGQRATGEWGAGEGLLYYGVSGLTDRWDDR